MSSTNTDVQQWISPQQLAQEFGVTRQSVHRWIRAGRIEATHLSDRVIRISPEERDRLRNLKAAA